jgi:hypothetical protein
VGPQALAEAMPELVPEVIAVDADRGWLLMRDLGAAELGEQDQSRWHEGIVAHASEESLREAAALGLVVGALYQVQSYRAILPTLMADGADDGLAGGDLAWIARSLARHERGLESPC